MSRRCDYLIIGAGILGLAVARRLKADEPDARVTIIDKEPGPARHASGRNSGVLHAGFYYTANSLKAKLTAEGNRRMKIYCRQNRLPLLECGKLVVAQKESEIAALKELEKRGWANGVKVKIVDEAEAREIEPNARTHRYALHSPDTATVDPVAVCRALREELKGWGVQFDFNTAFRARRRRTVLAGATEYEAGKVINCAGLYADKVARAYGFSGRYTIIPFKGIYLKYSGDPDTVRTHIYPVPNLKNPFLGVHFTKTVDGGIKIGPTAIPALWRENYSMSEGFHLLEFFSVLFQEAQLFIANSFGFRDLAFEEIRKYSRPHLVRLASRMVQKIDAAGFVEFTKPGIRAQLLNRRTQELVQDFVVEGDAHSVHVLNAVSPGFTCAFPFADHVVDQYIRKAASKAG